MVESGSRTFHMELHKMLQLERERVEQQTKRNWTNEKLRWQQKLRIEYRVHVQRYAFYFFFFFVFTLGSLALLNLFYYYFWPTIRARFLSLRFISFCFNFIYGLGSDIYYSFVCSFFRMRYNSEENKETKMKYIVRNSQCIPFAVFFFLRRIFQMAIARAMCKYNRNQIFFLLFSFFLVFFPFFYIPIVRTDSIRYIECNIYKHHANFLDSIFDSNKNIRDKLWSRV